MNVILPKARITKEEQARRQAAVDYARGSLRLEGFVIPVFAYNMKRRYVEGEITRAELTASLLAHYTP